MAQGYKTLNHWNEWLAHHFLGSKLLSAENELLTNLLSRHFGKHALLIGVPHQESLLKTTPIPYQSLLSPLVSKKITTHYIEGDCHELPILTGTIDLVILPHTLEFIDHPRQLLVEACRIIKPEGLIVISGFNSYSLWGLKRFLNKDKKTIPWSVSALQAYKVKNWLKLADFELEKETTIMFRPPVNHISTYDKLHFLETIGSKILPMSGGVYLLLARAKEIPLTPIRLKWKQQLSGIGISTSIPGRV